MKRISVLSDVHGNRDALVPGAALPCDFDGSMLAQLSLGAGA